ncbi:MAG TPA: elongation factor Ts, partial [Alcanivorax sp.]|nr:elongation factor Ts [Alcanivorax sp.]
ETDFVARDDNFLGFANKVAQAALDADEVDAAKIVALSLEDGSTVEQARES